MKLNKQIVTKWSLPMLPTYDNLIEQISRPLVFANGVVVLDKGELVKVAVDGSLIWHCPYDGGFWGSPVQLNKEQIVCASCYNQMHIVDRDGSIVRITDLPTSVSTEILVGEQGDLWFGMGAIECFVVRIDPRGHVVYTQSVARDQGLRQPLVLGSDRSLWAATNQSLVRLDAQSGNVLAWVGGEWGSFGCMSGAVACVNGGVFVVAALTDKTCAVLRVTNEGKIAAQYPIPQLRRARLVANPKGGAWVVGSTVSAWEQAKDEDCTFVIRLAPDGEPKAVACATARRAIEATVCANGLLWVGTYSYEDADNSEIGELSVYEDAVSPATKWIPQPLAGVGAPVLDSDGARGFIATSTALVAFSMESD